MLLASYSTNLNVDIWYRSNKVKRISGGIVSKKNNNCFFIILKMILILNVKLMTDWSRRNYDFKTSPRSRLNRHRKWNFQLLKKKLFNFWIFKHVHPRLSGQSLSFFLSLFWWLTTTDASLINFDMIWNSRQLHVTF